MDSPFSKISVEQISFPQHGPGPIQRPNKLVCSTTQQPTSPSYFTNSIQSPETPDVLDQINRLLDQQNSTTVTTSTSKSNISNSSTLVSDLSASNFSWTPFASTEWPSKYDSSWPLPSIQSPTIPLTTQIQNPFAFMPPSNDLQRQSNSQDSSVWSPVLDPMTPHLLSSSMRSQRCSTSNELFPSAMPSSTDSTKPTVNSWFKFWSPPDPLSTTDIISSNECEIDTNNSVSLFLVQQEKI